MPNLLSDQQIISLLAFDQPWPMFISPFVTEIKCGGMDLPTSCSSTSVSFLLNERVKSPRHCKVTWLFVAEVSTSSCGCNVITSESRMYYNDVSCCWKIKLSNLIKIFSGPVRSLWMWPVIWKHPYSGKKQNRCTTKTLRQKINDDQICSVMNYSKTQR